MTRLGRAARTLLINWLGLVLAFVFAVCETARYARSK